MTTSFMRSSRVLDIDTETDVIGSLQAAADFIERTYTNPSYWKWVILALHSAAQGCLALALRQGNGLLVQKAGRMNDMIKAHHEGTQMPSPYMDEFMSLYKKAQRPENFHGSLPALPTNPEINNAIANFCHLRNDLVHFNTKTWHIALDTLIQRSDECALVIQQILDSGTIPWRGTGRASKAMRHLKHVRKALAGHPYSPARN